MRDWLLERRELSPVWWGVVFIGTVIVAWVDFTAQFTLWLLLGNALFAAGLGCILLDFVHEV
jgi:hypothetical protein